MSKIPSAQAGYMELVGARKDGNCHKVQVAGGVSFERGCCNEFQPESKSTEQFRCGNCEYKQALPQAPKPPQRKAA